MEEHIWQSDTNSMLSTKIGQVMNTLLTSRPRKLEVAITRLGPTSQRSTGVSVEESLSFLRKYISDAVDKKESLDQILVPMIENSLKCRDLNHCSQAMILLNWLFQDELIFQALASNFGEIIVKKEDHYIALGWCTLMHGLVDYEITMNKFSNSGIRERRNILLKILCPSMPHLSSIVCTESTLQDGFELPTRLSVAAADCILVLTIALTEKAFISEVSISGKKSTDSNAADQLIAPVNSADGEKRAKSVRRYPQVSENMELEFLLWDHLDELIILVQRLQAWSRKGRPLHAKGLEGVLKWLQEIKGHYTLVQDEAGAKTVKTRVLLLSSCWKHYGLLLQLQDRRLAQNYGELLNQYISGIQFYMDEYTEESLKNKDGGIETTKFFLNCIALLLGRLDSKRFKIAMSEYRLQISRLLFSQLQSTDEDVIEGAVCILREIILKANYSSSTQSSLPDTQHMEAVLPLLLNLLDERENPARAVVLLTAECCSINRDGQCLKDVLKRIASENLSQRRNALNVISELVCMSLESEDLLSPPMWQDIAKHLLECLGDEELMIRVEASNLFPKIDPFLVLPALVRLVYSPDERVQSSASDAVAAVLKYHNQNVKVILILLDCLSNLCQSLNLSKAPGEIEGPKLDPDQVLRLIPEWSKSVQDWNIMIEPLVDKMFAEPSNAITIRFLSCISEHLADAADIVLGCVLSYMQRQEEIDEEILTGWKSGTYTEDDSVKLQHPLFDHLCPLLIIRILPLRVFNDLNSAAMYGQLLNQIIVNGIRDFNIQSNECLAAFLVNRAFHKLEFEDVRKLAAELCGRIHPQVLFPIIFSQLENAIVSRDILKIKACLFSVCTSLVVRGWDSTLHPFIWKIRKFLEMVLLWPSLDGDEVSKAQHGCIDCLALMICVELQAPASSNDSIWINSSVEEKSLSGGACKLVLSYVIQRLVNDNFELVPHTKLGGESSLVGNASDHVPLSFQLCMANVLISACQKISSVSKKQFAQRIIPILIHSIEVMTNSDIRAACLQVLFSAVYHLKSAVLPYSPDLLKLSIKALQKGSMKERMASAKLMASLMASEDVIVESISGGLLEARSVLSSISSSDPSLELRQVCWKLLTCITSPVDNSFQNLSI
ncbi:uncharacterized protein LOC122642563 isoform X2 [Telopea speciosissima]|uniref:uncharacterized protein LOC122642563 isoform X2 n=1 Tax=Telopea speciosissima TaxID=54955 RepID=UPI001CC69724|nr:uncharacterized protein LOC122642563 isoform X2 [Telopea speciosissima]